MQIFTKSALGLGCLAILLACSKSNPQPAQPKAIYGEDDRLDPYLVEDSQLRELSRTVVVLSKKSLQKKFCSGALIRYAGRHWVLTAGHCLNAATCDDLEFITGYENLANGEISPDQKRFGCREIALKKLNVLDLGLVAVDEDAVRGWDAVDLTESLEKSLGRNEKGQQLALIGHPSAGLKKIVADKACQVNAYSERTITISHQCDSFKGNSGSPIFAKEDGSWRLSAVLVSGPEDFDKDGKPLVYTKGESSDGTDLWAIRSALESVLRGERSMGFWSRDGLLFSSSPDSEDRAFRCRGAYKLNCSTYIQKAQSMLMELSASDAASTGPLYSLNPGGVTATLWTSIAQLGYLENWSEFTSIDSFAAELRLQARFRQQLALYRLSHLNISHLVASVVDKLSEDQILQTWQRMYGIYQRRPELHPNPNASTSHYAVISFGRKRDAAQKNTATDLYVDADWTDAQLEAVLEWKVLAPDTRGPFPDFTTAESF